MKLRIATLAATEIGLVGALIHWMSVWWMGDLSPEQTGLLHGPLRSAIPTGCLLLFFYYSNLYDLRVVRNFQTFFSVFLQVLVLFFFFLMGVYFFFPHYGLMKEAGASSACILLIAVGVVTPFRWILYSLLRNKLFIERSLILGSGPLAQEIAQEIEMVSALGYRILGFVDDGENSGQHAPFLGRKIVGTLGSLDHILAEQRPDRIIVALRERRGRLPMHGLLEAHLAGVIVEDGLQVHERLSGKLSIDNLTPGAVLFSSAFTRTLLERALRRTANLIVAFLALVLTSPLFVLIAVLVKFDSRGPLFFIQQRAGLNGKPFYLVKFRTMRPLEASIASDSVWARDDAKRITRVGKWVRRGHLDELPQLFNVIRGDMDLIGPRPEMLENIDTMIRQLPYYALRMTVRPGMTGWAQVKYGYAVSPEDVKEKLSYDLYYVKNRNLLLDLRILIDTIKIVLFWQGDRGKNIIPASTSPLSSEEQPLQRRARSGSRA